MDYKLLEQLYPTTLAAIASDLAEAVVMMSKAEKKDLDLIANMEKVISACIEIELGNNGIAEFVHNLNKR